MSVKVIAVDIEGEKSRQFRLTPDRPLVIGRGPTCDIIASSAGVSGKHVVFSVEAPQQTSPADEPQLLEVIAPNGPEFTQGIYCKLEKDRPNGYPLWKKLGDNMWIYSMTSRKWGVGGDTERRKHFQSSGAYAFCGVPHEGKMPCDMGCTWKRNNPAWTEDSDFCVARASTDIPLLLKVTAPNGPDFVCGTYRLDPSRTADGLPVWKQKGSDFWIYSMTSHKWGIGGMTERNEHFDCSGAYVFCDMLHDRQMPNLMRKCWTRNNPAWTLDENLEVTSQEPYANGHDNPNSGGIVDPRLALYVCDDSMNGTGFMTDSTGWIRLRKGEPLKVKLPQVRFCLPFRCKADEIAVELNVRVLGDGLPDPYDERSCDGRWRYVKKLGEGTLGIVYQATDMIAKSQGMKTRDVAVKMLKCVPLKYFQWLRRIYILHREAQWSLQCLHNPHVKNFSERRSKLFVKYLEDHTGGCTWYGTPVEWQAERTIFEAATFSWEQFKPDKALPIAPYVVMEVVHGETLHTLMGFRKEPASPLLSIEERTAVVEQATDALTYLSGFNLIHRDFRTTNLLWVGRGALGRLCVIDLGHMIQAVEENAQTKSAVIGCNWRETDDRFFDWAPDEVKVVPDKPSVNFAIPAHSFDIFSLGMLVLQLDSESLRRARRIGCRNEEELPAEALGFTSSLLRRMLGPPDSRPHPRKVIAEYKLKGKSPRTPARQRVDGKSPNKLARRDSDPLTPTELNRKKEAPKTPTGLPGRTSPPGSPKKRGGQSPAKGAAQRSEAQGRSRSRSRRRGPDS